jgi:predicted peptidase
MFAVFILLAASAASDDTPPTQAYLMRQRGKLVEMSRRGLAFELFLPANWSPDQLHPVIVFLHGRGESGGFDVTNAQSLPLQLLTNQSFTSTFPFIAIVPQCPAMCARVNHWTPKTLQSTTALLREWVLASDAAGATPTLGGDRARVYLAGQSMGGHGAWLYAAQQPRLFAAVVVVCGYAQGSREARTFAERIAGSGGTKSSGGGGGGGKGPAVALYHSQDDSVIPFGAAEQMAAALQASGYEPEGGAEPSGGGGRKGSLPLRFVRYDHAPGPPMPEFAHLIGHGSYELAFRDAGLYAWLLAHPCPRCSTKPPAPWAPLEAMTMTAEELR